MLTKEILMQHENKTTLVYDVPTRVFHWLFAVLFIATFLIAKTLDDESAAYPYHMMMGMTMAFAVVLRIVWGVVGTKYAKFTSFQLNPSQLLNYMKSLFTSGKRTLGHNPASSWAAIVMMSLALGSAVTGYLMIQSHANKEAFEDIHELFANGFLIVALAHIAGVVLHTLKHKDMIGLSMIHGQKQNVQGENGIQSPHAIVGLLFLVLVVGFLTMLNKNYDGNTKQLNIFGQQLQLGKTEDQERDEKRKNTLEKDEDKNQESKGENEESGDRDDD